MKEKCTRVHARRRKGDFATCKEMYPLLRAFSGEPAPNPAGRQHPAQASQEFAHARRVSAR